MKPAGESRHSRTEVKPMNVSEVMTPAPRTIGADESVLEAARMLADGDFGSLPVHKNDRLVGMLTDRDIVVRVVAERCDPQSTPVEAVLSDNPKYCFEDEDTEHVARNMDALLVRRLPVVSRDKRLVGIVSIEDIRPR
jgi:CBS domain-containing protein